MTSPAITENLSCSLCIDGKSADIFTCIGCSQTFCKQHIDEHKQILYQRLDKLILDHDQLQQVSESRDDHSMALVDEWERESIVKIQRMARDIREELIAKTENYRDQFLKRLKQVYEELSKAQNDSDFIETNLNQWSNRLDKLRSYLISPPSVSILDDTFISKLSICVTPDDIFEMFAGDLRIEDNGQIVEHGPSVAHAIVRGSGEYSSGEHQFRFKIEAFNMNKWIFFGIISHKVTMRSNTWAVPSSYGWGGQDSTILHCAMHAGLDGYYCDFQLNDIIDLLLDCDNRVISLTNKRTKSKHTMTIDLVKCPFPWHFHLNLFYTKDRVRILYTDNQ
jgi:hypothetical protein